MSEKKKWRIKWDKYIVIYKWVNWDEEQQVFEWEERAENRFNAFMFSSYCKGQVINTI